MICGHCGDQCNENVSVLDITSGTLFYFCSFSCLASWVDKNFETNKPVEDSFE